MKTLSIIAVLALAIILPFIADIYLIHVVSTIMIFMCLALSWDMMLRTGQLSFGTAGFFGLGAYAAIIAVDDFNVNPVMSIFVGAVFAALTSFGLGIAVLKLREMYFAITTLALTSVFTVLARNLSDLTGGAAGKILFNAIFDGDPKKTYWLILSFTIVVIVLSEIFERTRVKYAISSIRNDELVAKSSGINIFKYLLIVFVITSAIQGAAGAIYGQQYAFVEPDSTFSANFLLLPIAMALVGGIYSTIGPIVGALVLGFTSEYLKLLMPYGHLIIYGIIIVLTVIFLRKGVYGTIMEKIRSK